MSGSVTCGSPSAHPLHSPNGNPQKNPFSAEARHRVRPRPTWIYYWWFFWRIIWQIIRILTVNHNLSGLIIVNSKRRSSFVILGPIPRNINFRRMRRRCQSRSQANSEILSAKISWEKLTLTNPGMHFITHVELLHLTSLTFWPFSNGGQSSHARDCNLVSILIGYPCIWVYHWLTARIKWIPWNFKNHNGDPTE